MAKTLVEVNKVLGSKWSYWDGDGGLSDPCISVPYEYQDETGNTRRVVVDITLSGYVLAAYEEATLEERKVYALERIAAALEGTNDRAHAGLRVHGAIDTK